MRTRLGMVGFHLRAGGGGSAGEPFPPPKFACYNGRKVKLQSSLISLVTLFGVGRCLLSSCGKRGTGDEAS